jgi:hypothetical protein
MRPLRSGPGVDRYTIRASDTYLLFPYHVDNRVATLIPAEEMEGRYPGAWRYLKRYEDQLRGREANEETGARPFDDDAWYRFGRTQNLGLHDEPKLAVPATVDRLSAAFDSSGAYCLNNVRLGGILVPEASRPISYYWLLALLNSRLLDYIFKQQESTFANGYYQANRQFIDRLPIAPMDRDPGLTNQIVALAQEMHRLAAEQVATSPLEVGRIAELARQFDDADREMDELVCRAYGLNAEERALVFG